MEKQNAVQEGRTPCRKCQNGNSEYVCPACQRNGEKTADTDTKLDPEQLSEDYT